MLAVIPVLRSFNEDKALAFYCSYLEFTVEWRHRFEPTLQLYMQISRGSVRLHISEHHGDATPGSRVRISMRDLDSFHRHLSEKGYGFARPSIENMSWGLREMTVHDPFGNVLVFYDEASSS